ncbi:MAG: hypothetical protein QOJ85_3935, partial [Solirubrobacteraceae bacterium]|nr:hypothetical protein [Solirubrobacteraceae bacterium]
PCAGSPARAHPTRLAIAAPRAPHANVTGAPWPTSPTTTAPAGSTAPARPRRRSPAATPPTARSATSHHKAKAGPKHRRVIDHSRRARGFLYIAGMSRIGGNAVYDPQAPLEPKPPSPRTVAARASASTSGGGARPEGGRVSGRRPGSRSRRRGRWSPGAGGDRASRAARRRGGRAPRPRWWRARIPPLRAGSPRPA